MGQECSAVPPAGNTQVLISSDDRSRWMCVSPDFVPIDIRSQPDFDGPRTGQFVAPGDQFQVSQEYTGPDGVHYLKLADNRGWVYVSKPGVGCLCRTASPLSPVREEQAGHSTWRCISPDNRPVEVLSAPNVDGARTGFALQPGDVFRVSEEFQTSDGTKYLKLSDGRGWVFAARPGVGIFAEPEFWQYNPPDGLHIDVRSTPLLIGRKTGHMLPPGEVFCVALVYDGADGISYLKLADGRGWVFAMKPDVGVLCTRVTFAPIAALALDLNKDGKTDAIIIGADKNRDGVPDIVQAEPASPVAPAQDAMREAERLLEIERRARMEDEFKLEIARMAEQVTEWQNRAMAERKAKQEAEERVVSERRAKEEAEMRAQSERVALQLAKGVVEQEFRVESERKAREEALRLADAEQRAVQEASRRAEVERTAAARAMEAEVRERILREEAEQRGQVDRSAREDAERRAEIERLAAQQAREAAERLSIGEAEREALWRARDADRVALEAQQTREKDEHRALVQRLAEEVAEWQNRAALEHKAKEDAEFRVTIERTAKVEAERRIDIERIALGQAKDETERQFRIAAERQLQAEALRLADAETKAQEEADRFAEVERLAATRSREAAQRQLRVQSERMSFDPGAIGSLAAIAQPNLVAMGLDLNADGAIGSLASIGSRADLVLTAKGEAERRLRIDQLANERIREASERQRRADIERVSGVGTAVALDLNRDGRTDATLLGTQPISSLTAH